MQGNCGPRPEIFSSGEGKKNLDSPKNNIITLTMDFLQIKYFFENNMQYTDGELDFYKILSHFFVISKILKFEKKKVTFF